MGKNLFYRISVGLGTVTLLLFATNMYLLIGNDARRSEVSERQSEIDHAKALQNITLAVARDLGPIAVEHDDDAIRTLLRAEAMPNWMDAAHKKAPAKTVTPHAKSKE